RVCRVGQAAAELQELIDAEEESSGGREDARGSGRAAERKARIDPGPDAPRRGADDEGEQPPAEIRHHAPAVYRLPLKTERRALRSVARFLQPSGEPPRDLVARRADGGLDARGAARRLDRAVHGPG